MTKEYDKIQKLNAEVVAISVDDLSNARTMAQRVNIPFPVLYNPDKDVVRDYGVFNLLGDGLAAPATFIIDLNGAITFKHVGSSSGDRASSSQVLEQLRQLGGSSGNATTVAAAVASTPQPAAAPSQAASTPTAASVRPSPSSATPTQAVPTAAASSPTPQPTAAPAQAASTPTAASVRPSPTPATPLPSASPTPPPQAQFGNQVNDLAHLFTLPSVSGSEFSLEAQRGEKKVVLVFYRAFW